MKTVLLAIFVMIALGAGILLFVLNEVCTSRGQDLARCLISP